MDAWKKFLLFNHQQKAAAFIKALSPEYRPIQHTSVDYREALFILADHDVLAKRTQLEKLRSAGLHKIFIYPHSARPPLAYDFFDPWEHTTAQFVSASGHVEVLRRIGYSGRLNVVGWSLCPMRKFRPRSEVYNVLFAPIHPRNSAVDKMANHAVLERLYPLARSGRIHLTVRYLAPFEGNGIKRYENSVTYIEGAAGPDWREIDRADVVIAHQTFAYLSVARGIPTVMMGEDVTPHVEYRNGKLLEARCWDDYKDLIMYPIDLLQVDNALACLERAAESDEAIQDWRSRMIGEPFDGEAFLALVENYL